MLISIFQALLILLFPAISIHFVKRFDIGNWLSPVVLCYGIGILIANLTHFPINEALSNHFSEATILFAIPLLLYSTDIPNWLKYAKSTILSFALCVLSGIIATIIMAYIFKEYFDNVPRYASMMLGLFTGGAPNMQAVGMMLEAESEDFVLLNAADIFIGGCYLIFLTSVAHRFFGSFLPDFQLDRNIEEATEESSDDSIFRSYFYPLLLTVLVVGAAVGLTKLMTGALKSVVLIILLLTTFSILLSFFPKIRNLKKSFALGEYFLLMFCVAIGLLADFTSIWEKGGIVILYMASVWGTIIVLHSLLAYWFKIDRDTLMITATAAIYGPVFVGQVASAINNRTLLFSGIATGLIGYAIGNYLGIGMMYFLEYLLR